MSHRQLMLVHYLMGYVLVKRDGNYSAGFDHFVTASDLAQDIGDTVADILLANLAGSAARAELRFNDAIACQIYALDVLRNTPRPLAAGTIIPTLEAELLVALAGNEFGLGAYTQAQHRLQEARTLLPNIPTHSLQEATIDWIDSLLLRWQGRPEHALNAALRASKVYAHLAVSPTAKMSLIRLSTVVADIALDLAESRLADGYRGDHHQYVALARSHVKKATCLANDVQDLVGRGLAELTRIRFERVAGYAADGRVAGIENVIKLARQLHDISLLGQALTALGHELASLGRAEQARTRYRKALDVLRNSEVPAMGVWAQRALLRHKEMTRR